MRNFETRDFINWGGVGRLFCCCILFTSCLKNKDSTGDGPKSQMAIANYVVNGASFNILFDDNSITSAPISFGNGIPDASGTYLPIGAGIHNFKFNSGNNQVGDKNMALEAGKNYSLFLYDTLKNNTAQTLLLTDDLVANDTAAKARFLQLIPADSLTLLLKKDTVTLSVTNKYIGTNSSSSTESSFSLSMRPGNYQVQLVRNSDTLFQQGSLAILPGKLYSFIAKGVINGSGDYKEGVSVVKHN